MRDRIIAECRDAAKTFQALETVAPSIEAACSICLNAIRDGKTIFFCGNGGSAADAQHFAAELVGRYRRDRKALKAVALTVDSSILTSVGNDYGFDDVFSRQLEGLAVSGDVLIGISTSGNSINVLNALKVAHSIGVRTIGMSGRSPGRMDGFCDVVIPAPSDEVPHIQELHTAIGHIICGVVEEAGCA